MKVLVAVKRVADFSVKVRVRPDGTGVDLANAKMAMNPFDEIATEEAVRLKEAGLATEVIVVSVGEAAASETIRSALAIGADRGILVKAEGRIEPLAVAKVLRAVAERERVDLAILGKQAIDDDSNQTGQMLAALLGWPAATFASQVTIEGNSAEVTREVDGGHQTLRLPLPAVITVDLRLNNPRYPSMANVMKAKRKPIDEVTAADLGVDTRPRLTIVKVAPPPPRRPGVRVGSVSELIERLRGEAEVL